MDDRTAETLRLVTEDEAVAIRELTRGKRRGTFAGRLTFISL